MLTFESDFHDSNSVLDQLAATLGGFGSNTGLAPFVMNVANQDGSTATTGHGSPLTIMAAPGGDDIVTGGGPSETFVFGDAFGKDTVTDFYSHLSNDTISLPSSEFANFGTVMDDANFSGGTTIITASNGDQLTLSQLTQAAFQGSSADFKFT